jgi:hypothetical protein
VDEFRKLGHERSKFFFDLTFFSKKWDMRGPKFGEKLAHVRFLTFFVSLLTGSQSGLVKFFDFFFLKIRLISKREIDDMVSLLVRRVVISL